MTSLRFALAVAWFAALLHVLAACGEVTVVTPDAETVTGECEQSSECASDAPICDTESSSCRGCDESSECAGIAGGDLCETGSGQCVACLTSSDCGLQACDPETYACRPCERHDECDSEICEVESGECVEESRILYVDNSAASPGSDCTKTEPCLAPAAAAEKFSSSRDWMRVRPSDEPYQSFAKISFEGAHVSAEGAVFDLGNFNGTDDVFFRVEPGGSAEILGGTYANSPAVAMTCGAEEASKGSLRVAGATFDAAVAAVKAANCDLEIVDSEMKNLTDVAIQIGEATPASDVIIARNRIVGNDAGAVRFSGRSLSLRNNLIVDNLQGTPDLYRVIDLNGAAQVQLVNNTITGHAGTEASLEDTVVWCAGGDESPTLVNNIIWGNVVDILLLECFGETIASNILELDADQQGNYPGNTFTDPLFTDPDQDDYTPGDSSPAVDTADTELAPPVDVLGNPRDVGEGPDIGAIERQ